MRFKYLKIMDSIFLLLDLNTNTNVTINIEFAFTLLTNSINSTRGYCRKCVVFLMKQMFVDPRSKVNKQ